MQKKQYIAIDLKSYYASAECVDRNLDPLTTNLVVADETRTEKTLCLAVTPSLKSYGISGRARLFEVIQRVKEVNAERLSNAPYHMFFGESYNSNELADDPSLKLSFIIAPPRMRVYMEKSAAIYGIYLKYVSAEDIHVYSIDECFIDVTSYLKLYDMTAHELCMKIIRDVLAHTGITATGGIGTNMFLAKVAMDIVAKHIPADSDDVRIAELDEKSFREKLWNHRPLTDFWRIGNGTAKRLAKHSLYTLGDIARCSIGLPPKYPGLTDTDNFYPDGRAVRPDPHYNEKLLYKLFGVNAELLIDHSWGIEPVGMKDVKEYVPENHSLSSGQVLHHAYTYAQAQTVMKEMIDNFVLDMVEKQVVTDQIIVSIGYDGTSKNVSGPCYMDHYGRMVPMPAGASMKLPKFTNSLEIIMTHAMFIFESVINRNYLVRHLGISAARIKTEAELKAETRYEQMDLFTDYEKLEAYREMESMRETKEKNLQKAVLEIKKKYGKNLILKGMNFLDGANQRERNEQIGGHRA